jgi:hypothetical protein
MNTTSEKPGRAVHSRGIRFNYKEEARRQEKNARKAAQPAPAAAETENSIPVFVKAEEVRKAAAEEKRKFIERDIQNCLPKPKGRAKRELLC